MDRRKVISARKFKISYFDYCKAFEYLNNKKLNYLIKCTSLNKLLGFYIVCRVGHTSCILSK